MRKCLLAPLVAAATVILASPASAAPQVEQFEFPRNFVVKVESAELTIRFRCPVGDVALVGGGTTLSEKDPAYDPDVRVYASMDYYERLECTGKLQQVTLDLGAVRRDGMDETDGGYPRPDQLVDVTAYTDYLDSAGTIVTAEKTGVRVRRS